MGKRRVALKSHVTRAVHFRVLWTPQDYACRERSGSLKPGNRKQFCGDCEAARCLFAPSRERPAKKRERHRQGTGPNATHSAAMKKVAAEQRARGFGPNGKPLKKSCWNCVEARQNGKGYVCRFTPDAKPVSRWTMYDRRCDRFVLRLQSDVVGL